MSTSQLTISVHHPMCFMDINIGIKTVEGHSASSLIGQQMRTLSAGDIVTFEYLGGRGIKCVVLETRSYRNIQDMIAKDLKNVSPHRGRKEAMRYYRSIMEDGEICAIEFVKL